MNFNVLTLMPEMIRQSLAWGVIGRAHEKNIFSVQLINPRDFTEDVHQTVDDRPYGGGDGMVMMAKPLEEALASVENKGLVCMLSPQGEVFNDAMAEEWSQFSDMTFICGRYSGVDQRFLARNQVKEVSLGNYVISGGEMGALIMMDAVLRKKPGVLGHAESASKDSFSQGLHLEAPLFTRPQSYEGLSVPPILLSGDHKRIEEYRLNMGVLVTLQKRPELLEGQGKEFWQRSLCFLQNLSSSEIEACGLDKEKLSDELKQRLV